MKVQIYEDTAGEWRWRLRAGNNRTIADGSEGYSSKRAAERAVLRLYRSALVGELQVACSTYEVESRG